MVHSVDLELPKEIIESGGGFPLYQPRQDTYAWIDNVFTSDECDAIIRLAKYMGVNRAATFGRIDGGDLRDSNVKFVWPSEALHWVFDRLAATITTLNNVHFGFDLTALIEGFQFTEYVAPAGRYGWHVDSGGSMNRKLSLTIELTDPSTYEGGELCLYNGDETKIEKAQGRAVAFPSWTVHQVSPVTEGVRHSLVVWVAGPAFR